MDEFMTGDISYSVAVPDTPDAALTVQVRYARHVWVWTTNLLQYASTRAARYYRWRDYHTTKQKIPLDKLVERHDPQTPVSGIKY